MSREPLTPDRIIFVGGAPRSGTTLVQRILASHSQIYGGPEFDLIPEIVRLRNVFHASVESGRINKYLSHPEVEDLFAKFVTTAFGYKLAKLEGKTYISEKTPANVTVFPELAEMFPSSHLVLVVRDPRAIVASMLQVGRRFREDGKRGPAYTAHARAAVEYVNACMAAGAQVIGKHPNVHVVYYEDVVRAPEQAITQLLSGLGIPFEPQMIQVKEYDMPEFKGAEGYWYSKEQLRAPITHDSIESWRGQLTEYEVYLVCKLTRQIPELERYALAPEDVAQYRIIEGLDQRGREARSTIKKQIKKLVSRFAG